MTKKKRGFTWSSYRFLKETGQDQEAAESGHLFNQKRLGANIFLRKEAKAKYTTRSQLR